MLLVTVWNQILGQSRLFVPSIGYHRLIPIHTSVLSQINITTLMAFVLKFTMWGTMSKFITKWFNLPWFRFLGSFPHWKSDRQSFASTHPCQDLILCWAAISQKIIKSEGLSFKVHTFQIFCKSCHQKNANIGHTMQFLTNICHVC